MKYKRNQMLNRTYNEGYRDGVHCGVYETQLFFEGAIQSLEEVQGIGPKMYEKIMQHLQDSTKFNFREIEKDVE